eukprot:9503831-Pyramimonas_sp.AAC.3
MCHQVVPCELSLQCVREEFMQPHETTPTSNTCLEELPRVCYGGIGRWTMYLGTWVGMGVETQGQKKTKERQDERTALLRQHVTTNTTRQESQACLGVDRLVSWRCGAGKRKEKQEQRQCWLPPLYAFVMLLPSLSVAAAIS